MKHGIHEFILDDIRQIQCELTGNLKQAALFGSYMNSPHKQPRDIDIAIFLKGIPLRQAAATIAAAPLSLSLRIAAANGQYRAPTSEPDAALHYHLVLLDIEHLNYTFLQINRGLLLYLLDTTPINKILEPWGKQSLHPSNRVRRAILV